MNHCFFRSHGCGGKNIYANLAEYVLSIVDFVRPRKGILLISYEKNKKIE
jgi:hypothetical protein